MGKERPWYDGVDCKQMERFTRECKESIITGCVENGDLGIVEGRLLDEDDKLYTWFVLNCEHLIPERCWQDWCEQQRIEKAASEPVVQAPPSLFEHIRPFLVRPIK